LLVTGNPGKLAEARRLAGRPLESVALDLPEIQSLDLAEVLAAKAAAAFAGVGRPLVVEETGLELAALNGFPGPLVRWLLEAVGADGIARTALALGDARARAVCLLAWTDGERTVTGRGETAGNLVLPPRGGNGFGWDPVFRPDGETRTYGELSDADKDALGHRGRAWRDLLAKLSARGI
jgi:XTP/dITP diphosphohydrolase